MIELSQPTLRPSLHNGKWVWILEKDYKYTTFDGKHTFTIPKGFVTDLASIPSFARIAFDKSNPCTALASTIHDYMIRSKIDTRDYCDKEFKKILDITAPEYVEEVYYTAVSFWSLVLDKKRKILKWIYSVIGKIKW